MAALRAQEADQLVFEIVWQYIVGRGYAPALREIGAEAGFSPAKAQRCLFRLAAKGLLRYETGIARGISLPQEEVL